MSKSLDATLRNLNDCGCCEGISAETPLPVFNRPGLSAIAYRVGTHAHFKSTMLARLSQLRLSALEQLTTRDDNDFSIALLDAWATVADVLTFYQERIANENFLRTATERRSVLELARLIGYQLSPGVAAATYMAFTLEDAPGAFGQAVNLSNVARSVAEVPPPITIDVGVKIQSVPGPGELSATFETVEAIVARTEWNGLKPLLVQRQQLSATMGSIVFEGVATNLKRGDRLMFLLSASTPQVRTILEVLPNDKTQTTRINFETPALSPEIYQRPSGLAQGKPSDFAPQTPLNDSTTQAIIARSWNSEDLSALAQMQNWPSDQLVANINKLAGGATFSGGSGVFAFRQHASIFGFNAPNYDLLTAALRAADKNSSNAVLLNASIVTATELTDKVLTTKISATSSLPPNWENRTLEMDSQTSANIRTIDLDSVYPGVINNSWILLSAPSGAGTHEETFNVQDQLEIARSDYAISARVSRIRVESSSAFDSAFKLRTTAALVQSEVLSPARTPIEDIVQGDYTTLDRTYLGLKRGQKVILTGDRSDLQGVTASELLTIKEVIIEAGFTVLVFETGMANSYIRQSVTINANVAYATHGETVQETLGSGDATQSFQRFTLRQPPLTYTSASNPTGSQSTLEVRVNDLLWTEVPDLFGHSSTERIYITRIDDDGKTTVSFGDGQTGSRLPTGVENIKAKYRRGIGLSGLVKENKLSQLLTRPLGVKAATNPLPATGAEDREQLADARRNAPLTVLTLGRVVSLQDYEDFSRAFSGIAKALATWSWSGEQRIVLVTVAGVGGANVTDDLRGKLLTALLQFGDPNTSVDIRSYEPRVFRLAATLRIEPDYLPENVLSQVETLLRDRFSFDAREFGQPVHQSEVIAEIQNVSGVASVTLTQFNRSDQPADIQPRLAAASPRLGGDKLFAAELLTLDPGPIQIEVLK